MVFGQGRWEIESCCLWSLVGVDSRGWVRGSWDLACIWKKNRRTKAVVEVEVNSMPEGIGFDSQVVVVGNTNC